jgi:O-antigen ligase
VSQFPTTTEAHALLDAVRRQGVMDVARGAVFVSVVLLAWVSLHPFTDLSNVLLVDLTNGNETLTYLLFGAFAVLMLGLVARDNWPALMSLVSPGYVLLGGWIMVTVVLSGEPGTSIRRLALTLCVIAVAATLTLLAKSMHELMRWFGIAALALLAICYLGVLLVPHLSMHLATDAQEPALAGNWRGTFGHKNVAAAVMAILVFIGVYVVRAGGWISGTFVVALASVFLLFTAGKSSFALCLGVLILTSVAAVIPWLWVRALTLFSPLLLLNMLSIGTVMSDTLANIADHLPLDASFTGRTDIWTFGVQAAQLKLWTGYGFAAFWGSNAVKNLPEGMEWAVTAAHSHNGYLDTTLTMGLPGLALLIAVLVVAPLLDFQEAGRRGNMGPLAMLMFRIWLFGIYLSSLESFYFDRAEPIWFTFLVAIFSLHYLARFRTRE